MKDIFNKFKKAGRVISGKIAPEDLKSIRLMMTSDFIRDNKTENDEERVRAYATKEKNGTWNVVYGTETTRKIQQFHIMERQVVLENQSFEDAVKVLESYEQSFSNNMKKERNSLINRPHISKVRAAINKITTPKNNPKP